MLSLIFNLFFFVQCIFPTTNSYQQGDYFPSPSKKKIGVAKIYKCYNKYYPLAKANILSILIALPNQFLFYQKRQDILPIYVYLYHNRTLRKYLSHLPVTDIVQILWDSALLYLHDCSCVLDCWDLFHLLEIGDIPKTIIKRKTKDFI